MVEDVIVLKQTVTKLEVEKIFDVVTHIEGRNAILGVRRRGNMLAFHDDALDPFVQTALSFLQSLLVDYQPRDFAVRMWDGTQWDPEPENPTRFTLVLHHPGSLRKCSFH